MTTALAVEPANGFQALTLSSRLLAVLSQINYLEPTPIQAALIPHALAGRDVIGQAQTGTGKTAAFLLPFLESLGRQERAGPEGRRAGADARTGGAGRRGSPEAGAEPPPAASCPIYGGTRMRQQLTALHKGVDIAVGTPGRVLDHLARGTLNLDRVRYVVLDEADRMLDIGFRPDIERILRRCRPNGRRCCCRRRCRRRCCAWPSATCASPMHINLSPDRITVDNIRQSYVTVDEEKKFELLLRRAGTGKAAAVHHLLRTQALGGQALRPAAAGAPAGRLHHARRPAATAARTAS